MSIKTGAMLLLGLVYLGACVLLGLEIGLRETINPIIENAVVAGTALLVHVVGLQTSLTQESALPALPQAGEQNASQI